VDAYIETLEPDRKKAIETLRSLVFEVVPDIIETTRYNMPSYELDEVVCSFKSQKHYVSLYMDVSLVGKHKDQLAHLDVGKSCIRFKRLENLPLEAIRQILLETVEKQAGKA
jgi:uncharacterized protein YdhG (YjbR/CyaY superfamily)